MNDRYARSLETLERSRFSLAGWLMGPCVGWDRVKVAVLATVVFALLAHLFCWMNTMYGHDSLMIVQRDWRHQISIGRPFAPLYAHLRGEVVAPWLVGSLGTIWLALSNVVIVKLLDIRTRSFVAVSSGILATCAMTIMCNATYLDWFDLFMCSLLCACLAVAACYNGRAWGVPAGAVLLCVAMGLYQSYLQVAIVLVMAVCLGTFLRDRPLVALRQGLRGFVMAAVGFVLYYLVQRGVQAISGVGAASSYNATSSAFSFDGISPLGAVLHAWSDPISYLLFPETHAIWLCAAANAVLIALFFVALVVVWRKRRVSALAVGLSLLVVLLLPLGAGCINIAAYGNVHTLEIQSYFLFYPVVLMALDRSLRCDRAAAGAAAGAGVRAAAGAASGAEGRLAAGAHMSAGARPALCGEKRPAFQLGCCALAALLAFGVLASNIVYANQIYLRKDLEYQAAFSTLTRLETQLESLEGYVPGTTPVIVLGALSDNDVLARLREGFPPAASQMLGQPKAGELTNYAVGLWSSLSLYASHQLQQYFEYVLGCPINIVSNGESVTVSDEEAADMPAFPLAGSVIMRDGTAVVKLS